MCPGSCTTGGAMRAAWRRGSTPSPTPSRRQRGRWRSTLGSMAMSTLRSRAPGPSRPSSASVTILSVRRRFPSSSPTKTMGQICAGASPPSWRNPPMTTMRSSSWRTTAKPVKSGNTTASCWGMAAMFRQSRGIPARNPIRRHTQKKRG